MDFLEKLKAGRDALGFVEINSVKLGLRILTDKDYQTAGLAADALLVEHDTELSMSNADVFEAEKSIQLIALTVVDPETRKPIFPNVDVAREMLTRDDKKLIIEKYLEHEKAFSPSARTLSETELVELIKEVKKNPETPRLNDLSGDSLKKLITSLASPASN